MIDIIIGPSQQCLKQDYFDNLLNTENSYATTYSMSCNSYVQLQYLVSF